MKRRISASRICARRSVSGLTLIELVVSFTVVGVLVGLMAVFMRLPMESNFLSRLRVDLADSAELALRHMDQELRHAAPNSVRVKQTGAIYYLEFLATRGSGRYRLNNAAPAGACPAGPEAGTAFAPGAADTCFTSIGPLVTTSAVAAGSDYVVINNDFTNSVYFTGPANGPNKSRIPAGGYTAALAGTAPPESRLRFASNTFTASPNNLFYVVSGPVTYMCDVTTGRLLRYEGYAISAVQSTPPTGGSVSVMVSSLAGCALNYGPIGAGPGTLNQGIVSVELVLSRKATGVPGEESISLVAQIPVDKSQ